MHKAKTHLKHGVAFPRHQDTPKYQRQKLGKQSLKTKKQPPLDNVGAMISLQ
jgi:hypothetical protein